MKKLKSLRLVSLVVLGLVSCGKPGETATPNDKKSTGDSDASALLAGSSSDPSVWPLGRQAQYVIDIKCHNGVVATINGANSKPNSIVLPIDANNCLGILRSIKLGQRFYTPIRVVTDSDFAEGGKIEFVEKSDATDIMGIVIEKQIARSGPSPGSMVFRFTGITERRSLSGNIIAAKARSIFISYYGQTASGLINVSTVGGVINVLPTISPLVYFGCQVIAASLKSPGGVRISSDIMDLSKLSGDGLEAVMNSPAVSVQSIKNTFLGCGESVVANLPAIERMSMVLKNLEILTVKTTTITVGYSSGFPLSQCATDQAIIDPNQTYRWQGLLRAGDDIQPFMNGFKKYTLVNVGALHNDPDTANFICKLNGFAGGVVTAAGQFNSPNNYIFRWDAGLKVLAPAGALSDNNSIRGYLCKGKLQNVCKQDPSWIFNPSVPPVPATGKVADPIFGMRSGAYDSPQKITVFSPTSDAIIYYTIDGSEPNSSSAVYSGAIDISSTSTIKAIAFKAGFTDSDVATSNYAIIVGKPISVVEIGFEDGSDFDYNDAYVCLNGSFYVNNSEVIAAKDQQSVIINWSNDAKVAHLMTIKVTDISGLEIFRQSYQGHSKTHVMPNITLSMPIGSKLSIDLDHGLIQQNDIGRQPPRVQIKEDYCRLTNPPAPPLPSKL